MPSLATLDPAFRPYAEQFYAWARGLGAPLVVTSARRSYQEQAHLYHMYLAGRSKLTALPPGTSQHQRGLAFDMATPGVDPQADPWLAYLGPLWRSQMNGVWGGEADPVHFEASRAMTGRDQPAAIAVEQAHLRSDRRPRRRRRRRVRWA